MRAARRAAIGAAGAALALALSIAPAFAARLDAAPAADPARTCLAMADAAADAHGVPRAVMRALTRTETGRARGGALQPWPWTVNMEGAGHWFDSRAEALAFVKREMARGAVSFDVGCFQINWRWHGEAFESVEQMFDPAANADYAARFIAGLRLETEDWSQAAGYYHSRTPEFVARYRRRFDEIIARGDPDPGFAETTALDAPPRAAAEGAPIAPRAARPARAPAPLWRLREVAAAMTPGGVALRLSDAGSGAGSGALVAAAPASALRPARGPLLRSAARPLIAPPTID